MSFKLILSIFFSLHCLITFGEDTDIDWPHVIPRTPDVAAIEKYGDYPVGYNTGTADVSVPPLSFSSQQDAKP